MLSVCVLVCTGRYAVTDFHGDNTGSNPVGDAKISSTYLLFPPGTFMTIGCLSQRLLPVSVREKGLGKNSTVPCREASSCESPKPDMKITGTSLRRLKKYFVRCFINIAEAEVADVFAATGSSMSVVL